MKYVVVSPRVGTPGEIFTAEPGVNYEALLAGGFIKPAPKPAKSDKLETDPEGD